MDAVYYAIDKLRDSGNGEIARNAEHEIEQLRAALAKAEAELKALRGLASAYLANDGSDGGKFDATELALIRPVLRRAAHGAPFIAAAPVAASAEVPEERFTADATSAREFHLIAHPDPAVNEWIMSWRLIEGTVCTRTDIKISGEGLMQTLHSLGCVARDVLAASRGEGKPS